MDTNYTEEDLNVFTIPDLREILRARGLKVSGKKADLIERILTSQDIPEIYTKKGKTELPVRIIGPTKEEYPRPKGEEYPRPKGEGKIYKKEITSSFPSIISAPVEPPTDLSSPLSSPINSTSSSPRLPVYEVIPDSTFIKTTDAPNIILGDISWDLNDAPKTGNKDILMGQKLERNSSRLGYIGGKTLYELPKKELDNIIFHNLVAIRVPQLNKDEDGKYFLDEDDLKTFTLKPDTPSGSTLKHVLDSIYRQMFKIPPNKSLKDVKDIYGSVYIEYPFFEGLTKPTISSPSYKLLTSK